MRRRAGEVGSGNTRCVANEQPERDRCRSSQRSKQDAVPRSAEETAMAREVLTASGGACKDVDMIQRGRGGWSS